MPRTSTAQDAATPLEQDWIAAARDMLIEGGVAAVEINPLAARLGVTRGGFYWRFKNRQDLLDHLLIDWHQTNTMSFLRALEPPGAPRARIERLVNLWIDEKEFSPALDTAVRQWAVVDKHVEKKVRRADDERIEALAAVCAEMGENADDAAVRARVIYYHQVGYFTLGVRESRAQRLRLKPQYSRILLGSLD